MLKNKLFKVFGWYYCATNKEIFFGGGLLIAFNSIMFKDSFEKNFGSEFFINSLLLGVFLILVAIRERLRGKIFQKIFTFVLNLIIMFNAIKIGQLLIQEAFASKSFFTLFETSIFLFVHSLFPFVVLYSNRINNMIVRFLLFLIPVFMLVVYIANFIREAQMFIF